MEILISSQVDPIDPEDLDAIKMLGELEIVKVDIRKKIVGGLSGARTWLIDVVFSTGDNPSGQYILKIQNSDAAKREYKGYIGAIASSQYYALMPKLVGDKLIRFNKSRVLMLFYIAKGTLIEALPLGTLMMRDASQVKTQLKLLMKVLQPEEKPMSLGRGTPRQALQDMLGTLLKGQSSITARAISKLGVGVEGARLSFADDAHMLPNPIAYLENEELWGETKILWPTGPTHGDLNCQNVICGIQSKTNKIVPDLIDFSNFRPDGYVLYDLAYLEFDIILRLLQLNDQQAQPYFYKLCYELTQNIKLPKSLSGAPFVIQVREILEPIRNQVQKYWIEGSARYDDYYQAYWLASMATGLNYMRKVTNMVGAKVALYYAARSLENVLDHLNIKWTLHRNEYFIGPISEVTSQVEFPENESEIYRKLAESEQRLAEQNRLRISLQNQQDEQRLSTQLSTPAVQERIGDATKNISSIEHEVHEQVSHIVPPVYLTLARSVFNAKDQAVYMEQPSEVRVEELIYVEVRLTNIGREEVKITYHDEVSDDVILLQPEETSWTGTLQPGTSVVFGYRCYCTKPGVASFFTGKLSYPNNMTIAGDFPRTAIKVRPATIPARLVAKRYYWPSQHGIKVLVRLQNHGERIAKGIKFQETYPDSVTISIQSKGFNGDIFSGTDNSQTIDYLVSEYDANLLRYTKTLVISYGDSIDHNLSTNLEPIIEKIEYEFPVPELIGREQEINEIRSALDALWDLNLRRPNMPGAPVLLIEGREGEGKTRLLRFISAKAKESGHVYKLIWLDSETIRTHMRKLVIEALEIDNLEDPKNIEGKLRKLFPSEKEERRVSSLMSFIYWEDEPLTSDWVEHIEVDIVALLLRVSASTPLIILFDNMHYPPHEGAEAEIFEHVVGTLGSRKDYPILACLAYRPLETGQPEWIKKIDLLPSLSREINLGKLSDIQISKLLNNLIEYPKLNKEIADFIVSRSQGNPLYAIETLRLLLNSRDDFLIDRNGEWQFRADFYEKFEGDIFIPGKIKTIIEERFGRELRNDPELQSLLLRLSVVGYSFPLKLVEQLSKVWYPNLDTQHIHELLNQAEILGFLFHYGEMYQFAHTEKREILYGLAKKDEPTLLDIRTQIAELLIKEVGIYSDPKEQIQHIGRHLIRSRSDFAGKHVDAILKAAEVEKAKLAYTRSRKRFEKALQYLDVNDYKYVQVLLEIADIDMNQGNLDSADQLLDKVLLYSENLLSDIGERKIVGKQAKCRALLMKANILEKHSKFALALETMQKARVLAEGYAGYRLIINRVFHRGQVEHELLVELYQNMAEIYLKLKDTGSCRATCKKAMKVVVDAEKSHNKTLRHKIYYALGEMYRSSKNIEEAKRYYELTLACFAESEGDQTVAEAANALAELKGNVSDKKRLHERALIIQEKQKDEWGLATSTTSLAQIAFESENFIDAEKFYLRSLDHLSVTRNSTGIWQVYRKLARVYVHFGKWSLVVDYFLKAITAMYEHGYGELIKLLSKKEIQNDFNLAMILTERGQNLVDMDEAIQVLEYAELLLPKANVETNDRLMLYRELASLYEKSGRPQDAVEKYVAAANSSTSLMARAGFFESAGDCNADLFDPDHDFGSEELVDLDRFNLPDPAENYYLKSLIILLDEKENLGALRVYEKLLQRLAFDQAGLSFIPNVHIVILSKAKLDPAQRRDLAQKAADYLGHYGYLGLVGNVWAYTGNDIIWKKDTLDEQERVEALEYYRKAEETYLQAKPSEAITGLDTLIAGLHRLRHMDDIVRLTMEIFNLYAEDGSIDPFLKAYGRFFNIDDILEPEIVNMVIKKALETKAKLFLEESDEGKYANTTGLLFSALSDKYSDTSNTESFLDQARKEYERGLGFNIETGTRRAICTNLAVCLVRSGYIKEAVEQIQISLDLWESEIEIGRAITLSHAAYIFSRAGVPENRSELVRTAHRVYQQVMDDLDRKFTIGYRYITSDDIYYFRYAKLAYAGFLRSTRLGSMDEIDKLEQEANGLQVSTSETGFTFIETPYSKVNYDEWDDLNL